MDLKGECAEVAELLKVVVALLLRSAPLRGDRPSLRDQVQILSDLGVRPKRIAEILGRSPTYVTKELAGLRRAKRKLP